MTLPDNLTIAEAEEAIEKAHSRKDLYGMMLAKQLLDVMRENEALKKHPPLIGM